MTQRGSFRAMIAGLELLAPVVLRGKEYTGMQLAHQIAIDPSATDWEAERTPQLISELGRLVAAAYRDKEVADADYRVWRETEMHRLTNDLEHAKRAGFTCVEEGKDAKGKPKPGKPPSREAAEGYMRTLPGYMDCYRKKLDAEETWQTLFASHEAAKARTWAIRGYERSGADESRNRVEQREAADGSAPPTPDLPTDVLYPERRRDDGADLHEREEAVAAGPRSPLPPLPATTAPPWATATPTTNNGDATRRPAPPPPPTREG